MTDATNEPDLLYGCEPIAEFLGISKRAAYSLIERKRIPTFKIGRTIAARKSRLRQHFETLEKEASA
jgi:excisionase family DNA binding protein